MADSLNSMTDLIHLPSSSGALAGPDWRSVAVAWLVEVGMRSGSHRTPSEYGGHLTRFLATGADPGQTTPAQVHAYAYGIGRSGRNPSAATIAVRLAAVRGFFQFAVRMNLLRSNPAADVRMPRQSQGTPKGLTATQIRNLLAAIPETVSGSRDRAIVITMVLTGLRRTEVIGIRVGDISIDELSGQSVYRIRVKGGYQRHRDLPQPALDAIRESIRQRGECLENLHSDATVFAISSGGFYANLRRYAATAGLPGVTPHVLRHAAAKLRREAGASIEEVGALLGHRSLYTTARYLARLEGERDDGWQGVAANLGLI